MHISGIGGTPRIGDQHTTSRLGIAMPLRYHRCFMCADCFCLLGNQKTQIVPVAVG